MRGLIGGRCTPGNRCSRAVLTDEGTFSPLTFGSARSRRHVGVPSLDAPRGRVGTLAVCCVCWVVLPAHRGSCFPRTRSPCVVHVTTSGASGGARGACAPCGPGAPCGSGGPGGRSGAVPPVPIPHTAVQRPSAYDTAAARRWDNRSPPGHFCSHVDRLTRRIDVRAHTPHPLY